GRAATISKAQWQTASGLTPVSPRRRVMLSWIQSRSTSRLLTTGLRAGLTITGSQAEATGTLRLKAANPFTQAIQRAPVGPTSGASTAKERGVAAACSIQPS